MSSLALKEECPRLHLKKAVNGFKGIGIDTHKKKV